MISLGLLEAVLLAGCIAWWVTALVKKDGPLKIIAMFRNFVNRHLRENSPLECFHCTSFWVGILAVVLYAADPIIFRPLIQFFGILGIAMALRGASGEW